MSTPSGPVPGFEPPAYETGQQPAPAYPTGQPPPAYPMAPVATPDRMPRPAVITAAFWLLMAGAALFVIGVAATLVANMDNLEQFSRESLQEDGQQFTEGDVHGVARISAMLFTAAAAVLATPYVIFAALLRGGRNWARITLTVLVSIGGFVTALLIIAPLDLGARLAEVALVIIAIVIIVLMFNSTANPYFARRPPPPPTWYPAPPAGPDMRG